MRARSWTFLLAATLGMPAAASAQPAAPQAPTAAPQAPALEPHTQAEDQFRQARKAMDAHQYAPALDLLRASHAAEPGNGKLLNIAICEEALGRLIAAASHYELVAIQLSETDERRPLVASKLAALRPRIPTLQILVNGAVPGPWLTIDGQQPPPAMLSSAIPLDPGTHTIFIVAVGLQQNVTLAEGQHERLALTVPGLLPAPQPGLSTAPEPAPAPWLQATAQPPYRAPVPRPSRPADPSSLNERWALGVGLGILGLAGIGVGAGLGLTALARQDQSAPHCDKLDGRTYCDPTGIELRTSSRSLAWPSTLAFAAGAGTLAGGVAVLVGAARARNAAPAAPGPSASLTVGPGTVLLVGSW